MDDSARTTAAELVREIHDLVSLPAVAMRVNAMIEDPRCSAAQIGELINQDPGLTARLLRIANSAFYGLASRVETSARAVAVIGAERLRELVLATSAVATFARIPNELVSMEDFWCHSIYCALASRWLARERGGIPPDSAFVAGLLHDIGRLVIFTRLPEQAREALWLSLEGPGEPEPYQAERQVLGFDHAEVGGELARLWQLPASLRDPIEHHHQPAAAEEQPLATAIVHIANSVAVLAELDTLDPIHAPPIEAAAWELSGLGREHVEPAVAAAREQFEEVREGLLEGGR